MSKVLLELKRKIDLEKHLNFTREDLSKIYGEAISRLEGAKEFKRGAELYISLEAATSVGDLKSEALEDLLEEVVRRKLRISSLRMYFSYSGFKKKFSYRIDIYLGETLLGNQFNVHGTSEEWVNKTADRLEWVFSKVEKVPPQKSIWESLLGIIFPLKLVVIVLLLLPFIIILSKFIPNVTYAVTLSIAVAYGLIGALVQAVPFAKEFTDIANFDLLQEDKVQPPQIKIETQPLIIRILMLVLAIVGGIAAATQIIQFVIEYLK